MARGGFDDTLSLEGNPHGGWTVDGAVARRSSGLGTGSRGRIQERRGHEVSRTPRTPWGDPDLQGVWSGDSAQAIPMARPAQFAGRAELSEEEYKAKVDRDTDITQPIAERGGGIRRATARGSTAPSARPR